MSKLEKSIAIGLVAVVVLWLGVSFPKGHTVVQQVVGSVTGPDLNSPYWAVNAVVTNYRSASFNVASTSVCNFQSPGSTSTLAFAGASITTATSSVVQFEWGKGTQMDATTTSLGKFQLIASQKATILASTTPGAFTGGITYDPAYVFAPNTWLVLKYGSGLGTPVANGFVGTCKAEFITN